MYSMTDGSGVAAQLPPVKHSERPTAASTFRRDGARIAHGAWAFGVASAVAVALVPAPAFAAVTVYHDRAEFLAATTPTVFGFDDVVGPALLTGNEWAAAGLSVRHLDGYPLDLLSAPPTTPEFAQSHFASRPNALSSSNSNRDVPGYVSVCCGLYFANANSDRIRFEYVGRAAAAAIFVGENDVNGTAVIFRDGGGNVLYEEQFAANNPLDVFVGVVSTDPIAAIELDEAQGDGDGVVVDDVMFTPIRQGAGGGSGEGGAAGAGADGQGAGAGGDGSEYDDGGIGHESGCGCRTVGAGRGSWGAAAALALALLIGGPARRVRRGARSQAGEKARSVGWASKS